VQYVLGDINWRLAGSAMRPISISEEKSEQPRAQLVDRSHRRRQFKPSNRY